MVNKFAADMLNMPGNGDISAAVQEAEKSALTDQIGVIGENMQIRRAVKWEGGERYVSYHHDGGRVSVLVEVEGESDPAILNDICLHIAAFRPSYITENDVPAEVIEKEKEIAAAADPKLKDKPAAMLDKILSGKIRKFFSEVRLVDQPWVRDDKTTLAKLRPNCKVTRFVRWEVGEEL